MPDEVLLIRQTVQLTVSLEAIISYEAARALCIRCGEEIYNGREVILPDGILCKACAGEAYYAFVEDPQPSQTYSGRTYRLGFQDAP